MSIDRAAPLSAIGVPSVKVVEVRPDKPICKLETTVRNAQGETCVQGTATTYTMPLR